MMKKIEKVPILLGIQPILWYNNFAMLGNGLKWSFPNICVTNLLLVEWKFIISTKELSLLIVLLFYDYKTYFQHL